METGFLTLKFLLENTTGILASDFVLDNTVLASCHEHYMLAPQQVVYTRLIQMELFTVLKILIKFTVIWIQQIILAGLCYCSSV